MRPRRTTRTSGLASEDEQNAVYADYQAINQTPGVSPGVKMQPAETATTVRVEDGTTLTTDGPFVAVEEHLGYYLAEADDLDAAIELASRSGGPWAAPWSTPARGALTILEQIFRDEWSRVLAGLIGFLGDFDLADEAAQEAFAAAAERWPRDGTPENPRAWLMTTGRNRAIDRIRRDRTLAATRPGPTYRTRRRTTCTRKRSRTSGWRRLHTCCHPALALDGQVALTLQNARRAPNRRDRPRLPRSRGDDGQAARARERIKAAGIPFRVPPAHLLPDRLAAVLAVVYLIFNGTPGWATSRRGDPSRPPRW